MELVNTMFPNTLEGAREYFTGHVYYWHTNPESQASAQCLIDGTVLAGPNVEAIYSALIGHAAQFHGIMQVVSGDFIHNVLLQGKDPTQNQDDASQYEVSYTVGLFEQASGAHIAEWDLEDLPGIGDVVTLYDRDGQEPVDWTVVGRKWHRGRPTVKDALHILVRPPFH